ncbi:MAG: hypothetical protein Q4C01_02655 [Clostridia bacterium]|nr:hypothetical protein [Clostridia bacterium]
MEHDFSNGYTFILEGETEKEFYMALLEHLCRKHSATMTRIEDNVSPDIVYHLKTESSTDLIKFNVVNTVTQMPRAGKWFTSQCVAKYGAGHIWYVFLCYDTDDYKNDITKFHEGDWAMLRSSLKKAGAVIDMAAAADIEDVMLGDLNGICKFLSCDADMPLKGRKGKIK